MRSAETLTGLSQAELAARTPGNWPEGAAGGLDPLGAAVRKRLSALGLAMADVGAASLTEVAAALAAGHNSPQDIGPILMRLANIRRMAESGDLVDAGRLVEIGSIALKAPPERMLVNAQGNLMVEIEVPRPAPKLGNAKKILLIDSMTGSTLFETDVAKDGGSYYGRLLGETGDGRILMVYASDVSGFGLPRQNRLIAVDPRTCDVRVVRGTDTTDSRKNVFFDPLTHVLYQYSFESDEVRLIDTTNNTYTDTTWAKPFHHNDCIVGILPNGYFVIAAIDQSGFSIIRPDWKRSWRAIRPRSETGPSFVLPNGGIMYTNLHRTRLYYFDPVCMKKPREHGISIGRGDFKLAMVGGFTDEYPTILIADQPEHADDAWLRALDCNTGEVTANYPFARGDNSVFLNIADDGRIFVASGNKITVFAESI